MVVVEMVVVVFKLDAPGVAVVMRIMAIDINLIPLLYLIEAVSFTFCYIINDNNSPANRNQVLNKI